MLHNKVLYSYNDVMIEPAVLSEINSRSECNPFKSCMLPIFTAPMSTVVDEKNYRIFKKNGIIPIMPRNISLETRYDIAIKGNWAAFSLKEFKELFCNKEKHIDHHDNPYKVLIDVANGHMKQIYDLVREAKELHGKDNIIIMVGNIANPKTYFECYKAGVNFVRVSIGSGAGCITASNTGIYYSSASLIDATYREKVNIYRNNNFLNKVWDEMPQIVADGGVRNYSDVVKSIALGSDYVMIGSVLASLIESAGDTYFKLKDGGQYYFNFDVNEKDEICIEDLQTECLTKVGKEFESYQMYKEFYGMASREGQIAINGKKTKTSEGICKELPVIGSVPQWTENMNAYLRSAMSYCNVRDIKDFNPENVTVNIISSETKNSINK